MWQCVAASATGASSYCSLWSYQLPDPLKLLQLLDWLSLMLMPAVTASTAISLLYPSPLTPVKRTCTTLADIATDADAHGDV